MKQLSKEQDSRRGELVGELRTLEEGLAEAHSACVSAVEALNAVVIRYNEKVTEAETWSGEVTGSMQEYYDDRSEKWQEGEAGSEYSEWMDTWQSVSYDAFDEVTVSELPEFGLAQELEDLPSQPG